MTEALDLDFDDAPPPAPAPLAKRVNGHHHESFETATPVARPRMELAPPQSAGRILPHSIEAEEYLLSCCMQDEGETLQKAIDGRIDRTTFYSDVNGRFFATMVDLWKRKQPIASFNVAEELSARGELASMGGFAFITQVSQRLATTGQAGYLIERVRSLALLRSLIREADAIAEESCEFKGDVDGHVGASLERLRRLTADLGRPRAKPRGLFDFEIPPDGDHSILLGDRYLNRGDAAVVVSSSGMGKSALALQMATELALNRGPFGIKGNGPLKSLIIQAEDSDGDIAEVAHSLRYVLKLTPADQALVNERVRIVTERVSRGDRFISTLRVLIDQFQPDLVIINPLQAFIDGDVTDSQDLGKFLREGLNGLNEPAKFGYIVIHHTTKPATGKERSDRKWHEVMYDMAGGAEIINWARAILSLRPAETEGEFNLVLAKRGRRAGVTKKTPQGVGFILEPTTEIPLQHSKGRLEIEGVARSIPVIFWEAREPKAPDPEAEPTQSSGGGRPQKYLFKTFRSLMPSKTSPGLPIAQLHRAILPNGKIPAGSMQGVLNRWIEEGFVEAVEITGQATRYRAVV